MELDEDDLALINALQIAPRLSWQDASAVLGAHATSLAARWERLRAAGAAWVTAHPVGDPQQMCLALVDIDCDLHRRAAVTAALAGVPAVVTIDEAASNRDLLLTVITPSLEYFTDGVVARFKNLDGLLKYRVRLCTRLHRGGDAWRLNVLDRAQEAALRTLAGAGPAGTLPGVAPAAGAGAPLPESHRALLPFLSRDGRATAAAIARSLGRNPSTVQRQLNRVLASGLLSFRCEIAQKHSGFPVTCQWFATIPADQHGAAAKALRGLRNVRLCASTTGRTNFVIVMWLQSLAEVLNAEVAMRRRVPGIELAESVVTLSPVKRVGWMLNPDSTSTGAVVVPGHGLDATS